MSAWHTGRLAGFDTESSGLDVESDRIVTAAVVQCGAGHPTQSATWLADPGVDIPAAATAVHGITTERVRTEGRPAAEVVEQVVSALTQVVLSGVPVVAMNAAFDLTLLDREARRHGIKPLTDTTGGDLRVIDPMVIDRQTDPYRPGRRTLTDLCQHYQVALDGAHTADADAIAACRVAWRIGQLRLELAAMPVDELHARQVVWAAAQAAERAAYFGRTPGKEHLARSVRGDWPLVPKEATDVAR